MSPDTLVPPLKFIITTKPQDIKSPKTRLAVALQAARFRGPRKKKPDNNQTKQIVQSFLSWRFGSTPARQQCPQQIKSSIENEIANYWQAQAEIESVVCDVPASLPTRPSLQQCRFLLQ